ncbi:MAG TPA: zinc-binding dehydrogenase, partial [Ottowia sp.]|nr:zinc-binding dehydrogenase [Ottowia sp.]
ISPDGGKLASISLDRHLRLHAIPKMEKLADQEAHSAAASAVAFSPDGRLIATAGSEQKCALALANGAQAAINYRAEDFAQRVAQITDGQGVKVVYDSVGKDTWEGSLQCLRPFGLMASFGNASGPVPPFAPAVLAPKCLYVTRATLFTHIATRERCQAMADELFAVVRSGQVRIHIDQRFALQDVQAAHRALEARQTTGSTILTL